MGVYGGMYAGALYPAAQRFEDNRQSILKK